MQEEGGEAQMPKTVKPPIKPTKEVVNEHMISHLPFRTWCAHCAKGKSKSKAHRRRSGESAIPMVSTDYTFMSENQERGCYEVRVHHWLSRVPSSG